MAEMELVPAPDGDEPLLQLPKPTVEFLMSKVNSPPPRWNYYRCPACLAVRVTVDIHRGVTPMFMTCLDCGKGSRSAMYPGGEPPTSLVEYWGVWEWYRPSAEEYAKLSREMREHVDKGGLSIRRASTHTLEGINENSHPMPH